MIGKLLGRDEVYTALLLALSGYAMVAVARGGGASLARERGGQGPARPGCRGSSEHPSLLHRRGSASRGRSGRGLMRDAGGKQRRARAREGPHLETRRERT
jgi:hypothetical protein